MFTEFLWLLGAKHQHDNQAQLGVAGLSGLLLTFFVIWKWDSIFYPLLHKTGLIDFANRVGLINESPVITVLSIVGVISFLSLIIALSAFVVMVIGATLMIIGATKIGKWIIGTAALLLFLPLILILLIAAQFVAKSRIKKYGTTADNSLEGYYHNNPKLQPLLEKYQDKADSHKLFNLYVEQLKRDELEHSCYNFSELEAQQFLNRTVASIRDDRNWLIGYDEEVSKWYVLFPNPLPAFASTCADHNLFMASRIDHYITCSVDHYFIQKGEKEEKGFYVPSIEFDFRWKNKRIEPVYQSKSINLRCIKNMSVYRIQGEEINNMFNLIANGDNVYNYLLKAHITAYLIPIAFWQNKAFQIEREYQNAVSEIPSYDTLFPVYQADVISVVYEMACQNKSWAKDWLELNHN